jgi:hypothetical protein
MAASSRNAGAQVCLVIDGCGTGMKDRSGTLLKAVGYGRLAESVSRIAWSPIARSVAKRKIGTEVRLIGISCAVSIFGATDNKESVLTMQPFLKRCAASNHRDRGKGIIAVRQPRSGCFAFQGCSSFAVLNDGPLNILKKMDQGS